MNLCKCGCGELVNRKWKLHHYIPTNRTHGDHLTRLYALWRNMRHRCACPTSKDYKYYGAKGIKVAEEWNKYQIFKKWALKNGYKEGLTIERINNLGGYDPNNCMFITTADNNKNRSNSYWWFIFGKRFKSSNDAARYWNVTQATICSWCGLRAKSFTMGHCYAVRKYPNGTENI